MRQIRNQKPEGRNQKREISLGAIFSGFWLLVSGFLYDVPSMSDRTAKRAAMNRYFSRTSRFAFTSAHAGRDTHR
jgi:hypothetical protein